MRNAFFQIVRLGIGHSASPILNKIDWNTMEILAARMGLSAVIIDGLERLPDEQRPPKMLLLSWIGTVVQAYERRNEQYRRAIAELARLYHANGYKMMVVKGLACCLDWPKPEHRACGDIDIWQFGEQKKADKILKDSGVEVDSSHHHHTVFNWQGFSVENHYDFINVHHHKSHVELERILKELGKDDSHYIELYGEKVYLPSPNLHALFLIKHAALHFTSTELTLRQVLDWAFFVEKHGKEVDWNWLLGVVEEHGMLPFFKIMNAICVEDLGFDVSLFPQVQFKPASKERVLNDILSTEFTEEEKGGLIRRSFYKYRRWRANEWKHKLCYKDSMWSAFWSGVWNHLLKPASI